MRGVAEKKWVVGIGEWVVVRTREGMMVGVCSTEIP